MKISSTAPLHLSNREVLSHFLNQKIDNDHLASAIGLKRARDKAFARKKYPSDRDRPEDDDPSMLEPISEEDQKVLDTAERRGLSDELVWIQDEVIKYLCSEFNPTARQTPEGVAQLADELQDHQLTKAEVLQLCNLAPTEPVTLYAIIEEADSRFYPNAEDKLDEIGNQIYDTLLSEPPAELAQYVTYTDGQAGADGEGYEHGYVDADMEAAILQQEQEQEFVFEGREVGVEDEKDGDMD
ncbi:hypothetical protein CI109_100147 [Kwoniella shandongensis]|uniref:DNA-directed RNA polymerase III subunit RPC9 n=1 Tax=Kwoniella shandongensis TaxID=1734106 RepID=A0A5M6BSM1_9TREE|nr:uncharacterized protein CI109_005745 [Kwoniella shandongensis]KAA5525864.1 hypothetical protein CI109_005745 [Kwoniella shandongensis]